jgi:hypothetical protein
VAERLASVDPEGLRGPGRCAAGRCRSGRADPQVDRRDVPQGLARGRGKSGGVRVIYYWATAAAQIYLMTIYGKSERSDIDRETLRRIANKLELLE